MKHGGQKMFCRSRLKLALGQHIFPYNALGSSLFHKLLLLAGKEPFPGMKLDVLGVRLLFGKK